MADVVDLMLDKVKALNAFDHVEYSEGLANIHNKPITGNATAWVGDLYSTPQTAPQSLGVLLQDEQQVYGVVIAVRVINDPTAASVKPLLREKRRAIRSAFFDWQPTTGYQRFSLAGAEQLSLTNGVYYWVERFKTEVTISQENLL